MHSEISTFLYCAIRGAKILKHLPWRTPWTLVHWGWGRLSRRRVSKVKKCQLGRSWWSLSESRIAQRINTNRIWNRKHTILIIEFQTLRSEDFGFQLPTVTWSANQNNIFILFFKGGFSWKENWSGQINGS